ncbi:MAG: alpha-glucosidase C-terminal domain-containing protein, partial [Leptospiraceae bacterium]|nr:alpha-glucosidase C-terminal domain-containing protein [Leptospiraceae bacterium]
MKRIVGLRKQHRALHEGELEFIYPENRKMLVFLRRYDDEKILVVANLSRHVQYVELDLEKFEGLVPMELFGHTRFPPIGELPYFLTLAPYSFYWFELTSEEEENGDAEFKPPLLENVRSIRDFFPARKPGVVQNEIVPNWLRHARWFAGKNRRITGISIIESIMLSEARGGLLLLLVQVEYTEGESEIYQVLLTRSYEDQAEEILEEHPRSVLARLNTPGEKEPIGILHDALVAPRTAEFLLDIIKKRRRFKGEQGHLSGAPEKAFRRIEKEKAEAGDDISDEPDILRGEQSNTSIAYGEKFILKFFRRLEEGTNPDLEIGKYFQDRTRFRYVPSVAGSIEYEGSRDMSLGILHEYRDNQGDAWNLTLDSISHFYDNIVAFATGSDETPDVPELRFIDMRAYEPPEIVAEAIGTFPITVELLGQRTAEMHLALAAHPEHPGFEQEPFSSHYQRGLYQSLRNLMDEAFSQLRSGLHK